MAQRAGAALGCGDEVLADAIAAGITRDLRDLRAAYAEHPWRDADGCHNDMFAASEARWGVPELPDSHTKPEVVAAFEALLDKHQRRRRRRRPPTPPPTE